MATTIVPDGQNSSPMTARFVHVHPQSCFFRIQSTHAISVICKPSIWFETIIWLLIICISSNYRKTRWSDGFRESAICATLLISVSVNQFRQRVLSLLIHKLGDSRSDMQIMTLVIFPNVMFCYGKVDSLQKIRCMLRQFLNKIQYLCKNYAIKEPFVGFKENKK